MTTPEHMHERLVRVGAEWAELNSAAELLEETKKSVRSQYVMEHLKEAKTVAKAEHMADSDERYREHLALMVAARKKANIGRVNFDAAKTYIELYRSQQANERAAMSLR